MSYRKSYLVLLGLLSVIVASTNVLADDVVVTATRTPEPVEEVLAPVTVITREELANSLSADVTELLRFRAGVEIGRNGGIGQPVSIFIRGANSSHTLVLIDGVRINPGTFGTASLQNIPPDTIERIEIVKGPRSTLYGTDAIGGVINIITRKPPASGGDANAMVGYGSFNTKQASGSIEASGDAGNIGANAFKLRSDGFPTRKASTIDSPYDNLAVGAHAGSEFGDVKVGARFYQTTGTSDYLNSPTVPLSQDFLDRVSRVNAATKFGDAWDTRVVLSRFDNSIEQNQVSLPAEFDYLKTQRDTLDWQNDVHLPANMLLTAGAMYAQENARALSFGTFYDRNTYITNVYAQDRWSADAHALLLAVGYTNYSTFGAHATWNAEYGYAVNQNVRLVASAGTAFHAPNATDLYGFGGNPNLDPEQSHDYELSLRYQLDRHAFSLTAFQNDVDNLILFDNVTFAAYNTQAHIRGYEFDYAYTGDGWRVHAEALYNNPEDRTKHQLLTRRAKRSANMGYVQTLGDWELGFDSLYSGPRMDFGTPVNIELGSYVLVNLHARYAITKNFAVVAQVDNLLNTQYELVNGYNTADRSGSIALKYSLR